MHFSTWNDGVGPSDWAMEKCYCSTSIECTYLCLSNATLLRCKTQNIASTGYSTMELDHYDIKLLGELQKNAKTSQRQLSEVVNLSASAVNRRIAQYEAAGLVTATVALVDPVKAGRPITIAVEVKVESERLDLLDEIKMRFYSRPQVQQIYYITGDFDFLLIINTKDMVEYEQLTREIFFEAGNVKTFKTYVVMQTVKASLTIPLE